MLNLIKYPYSYRAFQLNFLSQLPIVGFESVAVKEADVLIHEGKVPESLPDKINKGVLYESSARSFLLKIDGVARYYAHDGQEIVVQRSGDVADAEVSAFLNGTVIGAILQQRGMLPLHASMVFFNGKGLLFAGMSGSGKSTLAAALIRKGATLVADDISVINFSSSNPSVLPAFPTVKLWEDSLKQLKIPFNDLQPVRNENKKFYLPVEEFSKQPVKMDCMFILKTHNRFDYRIEPVKGVEKFNKLKNHTYFFRGIPNTGLEQNHFRQAHQLATQVPTFTLTRPNAEFDTEKLIETITNYLSG